MIKEVIEVNPGDNVAICICDYCGEEFKTAYCKAKRGKHNFCNRIHASKWKSKNLTVEVTCHWCGKKFKTGLSKYNNSIKQGYNFYCNQKCKDDIVEKPIERTCAWCGKKFEVIPSRVRGNNFCKKEHYTYWAQSNKNPQWKNGRSNAEGYVTLKKSIYLKHEDRTKSNYILEHRFVMEQSLGRKLYPYETVHHINGIRDDNRIENLELLPEKGKHNTQVQKVYQENLRLKQELAELKLQLVN